MLSVDALRAHNATRRLLPRFDGLLLAALGVAIGLVYGVVVAGLWNDWWHDENYAHGLLLVPVAGWLIWNRRRALAAMPRTPSASGAVIVAFSLVVFLVGQAAMEFFLTRLSLVGVLAGIVVQLLGWRQLRALRVPLLLFILSIPLPALILNELAFPLQLLASRIGVAMLSWIDIPVVREGNVIVLQHATLEVAEACSGVRSLISIVTLALAYGSLTAQRRGVRVTVIAAAVPVVLLANGMRVAGAGIAAHVYGPGAASGFLHTFSGWIFFAGSVALLLAVERAATLVMAGRAARRGRQ